MPGKELPKKPVEMPTPGKVPEIYPDDVPESPVMPEEQPAIIPDEAPFETPATEVPQSLVGSRGY